MAKYIAMGALGTLSYWVPIIVVFAIAGTDVNVFVANFVALVGFLGYWTVLRRKSTDRGSKMLTLIELYFFGPLLLSTATTFGNGGFTRMHGWTDIRWLLLACVFPPLQFLLAATSGLWPSLTIVSLMLLIGSVR